MTIAPEPSLDCKRIFLSGAVSSDVSIAGGAHVGGREKAGRALFERNADPFRVPPHKAAERPVSVRSYSQGEELWDFSGGC
jgi:hypothetical protein